MIRFLIPAILTLIVVSGVSCTSESGGLADKIAGTYFVELDDGVTTRITSLTATTPSTAGWLFPKYRGQPRPVLHGGCLQLPIRECLYRFLHV